MKYEYVADKVGLNILPSLLNSLAKDGFEIWQISPLNVEPAILYGGKSLHSFLVIARKLLE